MKTTIASIVALLSALTGNAAPPIVPEALGYEMGQAIEGGEREFVHTPPWGLYVKNPSHPPHYLDTPEETPEPFTGLELHYTAKAGLCYIWGWIRHGHDLYPRFVETFTERYGGPNTVAYVEDPERTIAWRQPANSSGIYGVVLHKGDVSVDLYYYFYNYDQCWKHDPFLPPYANKPIEMPYYRNYGY